MLTSNGNSKICKLKFRQIREDSPNSPTSPSLVSQARITGSNGGVTMPENESVQRHYDPTGPETGESFDRNTSKKALAGRKNVSGTMTVQPNEEGMSFTPVNGLDRKTVDLLAASRIDDMYTRKDLSDANGANDSNNTWLSSVGDQKNLALQEDSSGLKRNTSQISSLDPEQSKRARLQEHSAHMLELLAKHSPSLTNDNQGDQSRSSFPGPIIEGRSYENTQNTTCEHCRRMKVRCDRQRPCSHCQKRGYG